MQVLTPSLDYTHFLAGIPAAPARVLLLDYDGTLAPFHVRPEEARPYPELVPLLRDIMRSGATRVVLVSGRPARELPPLLGLDPCPEIWGAHGWERLTPDGALHVQEPTPAEREALATAQAAAAAATSRGARLERKLASIALHWRGLPEDQARACSLAARDGWRGLVADGRLALLEFDGGLELRAPGCNKQHAVKAVLAETPTSAAIAYLGDDVTDEDAFLAVKARGVSVLVRSEFRQTHADVWLRPPRELADFLERWRAPSGGAGLDFA